MTAAHRWRRISEEELARMVARGTYLGAGAALERARTIKKAGHAPAIFHNRMNGFMVLDASDPAQRRRMPTSPPATKRGRRAAPR